MRCKIKIDFLIEDHILSQIIKKKNTLLENHVQARLVDNVDPEEKYKSCTILLTHLQYIIYIRF